jgi:hypothetical protein
MIRISSKRFIIKSRTRDSLFEELDLEFDRLWGSKKSGSCTGLLIKNETILLGPDRCGKDIASSGFGSETPDRNCIR